MIRKTAIVIGATGLVGKALVNELANSDHFSQVITLTRKKYNHNSDKVINHVIQFDDLALYANLFKADCFFSCLGTTKKQAGSINNQRKVDFTYQLKAAQLAIANDVSHYLLVSSSGANENSTSQYLKMKGELELKIKQLPFNTISIFQPSLLIGSRDEFRFAEKIASWFLGLLCKLPFLNRYRPISGKQVAIKMIQTCLTQTEALTIYNLDEIFI